MDADFLHEQAYLQQTRALIQRSLTELHAILDDEQEKLMEAKQELQENQPAFADDRDKQTETAQYLSGLQTQLAAYRAYTDRLRKLNILHSSPYFGRIDFAEEDLENETYYIGLASLRDPLTYQIQICDWRAPMASLFYRSIPGEASFMAPGGEVSGRLLLKRQYEISDGELLYYFDTDFHIKDGILKKLLSQPSSTHMKAIVESLQDTQDRLIRRKSSVLLIQGSAGSGKTVLAMHRAAFLMYQDFQDSLTSKEILIISPNHLFSQYVSHVLPELGEENITSLTFDDLLSFYGSDAWSLATSGSYTESLLSENDPDKFYLMQDIHAFKHSEVFAALLDRLADYYERRMMQLPDVYYHHSYIATRQELKEEILRDRGVLPLAVRLEQMRRRLSDKIHMQKKARLPSLLDFVGEYPDHQLEVAPYARLLSMKRGKYLSRFLDSLPVLDIPGIYRQLWGKGLFYRLAKSLALPDNIEDIRQACEQGAGAAGTGATGTGAPLDASDCLGLIWLKMLLEGASDHPQIRQVMIDEAQDYGAIHFMLLKKWFSRASFTVLGDVQQCLSQTKRLDHYQAIGNALGEPGSQTAVMRASFRSTWEISGFCRRFLDSPDLMEPFERHGLPVEIFGAKTNQEAADTLLQVISRFRSDNTGSIAVICKTAAQSAALYELTKGRSALQLVRDGNAADLSRSSILPLYLVKGLEFDGVILWDVNDTNYALPDQKRFLYLAASRALHRLALIYTGRLSPLAADPHHSLRST
ncbi:MAG: AAA family ATPase [Clostridiales bacterium]|nr:AAA family ATPase [Clostridiales bacterium]